MTFAGCELRRMFEGTDDARLVACRLIAFSAANPVPLRAIIDIGGNALCTLANNDREGAAALADMRRATFEKVIRLPLSPDKISVVPGAATRTLAQVRQALGLALPSGSHAVEAAGAIFGLEEIVATRQAPETPRIDQSAAQAYGQRLQQTMIAALREYMGGAATEAVLQQASIASPATDPNRFVAGCASVLAGVIGPGLARTVLQRSIEKLP